MNFKYRVGIAMDFSAQRTHSVDPLLRKSTHPMEVRCIITPLSSLLVEVAKSAVTTKNPTPQVELITPILQFPPISEKYSKQVYDSNITNVEEVM